jgi:hypothetical protein
MSGHSGGGLFDKCGNLIGMNIEQNEIEAKAVTVENLISSIKRIWKSPVNLTASNLCSEYQEDKCTINFVTKPDNAIIYIDDKLYGESPTKIKNFIRKKNYKLTIKKDNYFDYTDLINCNKTNYYVILKNKFCQINVDSSPQGAEIFIDGTYLGYTPITLQEIYPNRNYEIEAVKKGYINRKEIVSCLSKNIDLELQKRRGNIRLKYTPGPDRCKISIVIQLGDKRFSPSGNITLVDKVELGNVEYKIGGALMCSNGYAYPVEGNNRIDVINNGVYILVWRVMKGICYIEFKRI